LIIGSSWFFIVCVCPLQLLITLLAIRNHLSDHLDTDEWNSNRSTPPVRLSWIDSKIRDLSEAPDYETASEEEDRLQELEWLRIEDMTSTEFMLRRSYRKAERTGVGKPSRPSFAGGVLDGDEGWKVVEDGSPGRKMMWVATPRTEKVYRSCSLSSIRSCSDLVFVQDATGSMGSYISSGKGDYGYCYEALFIHTTLVSIQRLAISKPSATQSYPMRRWKRLMTFE
jgi:hypothetical protein